MSQPKPCFAIANWKMNSPALPAWVQAVAACHLNDALQLVLCPPFTQLAAAMMVLQGTNIALGAQNCHQKDKGAYTGDISADMLRRAGCSYVIIGHSERRQHHGETDELVAAKALRAVEAGLCPVICIGETAQDREEGNTQAVLLRQLEPLLPLLQTLEADDFLLAYEPVWAIGSGLQPAPEAIEATHHFIKKTIGKPAYLLYGGSVKPENAAAITALPSVDGVLVGGASLDGAVFGELIKGL